MRPSEILLGGVAQPDLAQRKGIRGQRDAEAGARPGRGSVSFGFGTESPDRMSHGAPLLGALSSSGALMLVCFPRGDFGFKTSRHFLVQCSVHRSFYWHWQLNMSLHRIEQ